MHTFTDVQASHTISVSFVQAVTFTITASAGTGGSISPSGSVSVNAGDNQTFNITADPCYSISDVIVDGVSRVLSVRTRSPMCWQLTPSALPSH